MSQVIFTYHDGEKPDSPESGHEAMQQWKDWAAPSGSALVNPGTPVGITKVLTKNGISSDPTPHPIDGFSIIEAESMDAALTLLKNCPHLHMMNGTLEVSEMMSIP